jgi:hypothetical protein
MSLLQETSQLVQEVLHPDLILVVPLNSKITTTYRQAHGKRLFQETEILIQMPQDAFKAMLREGDFPHERRRRRPIMGAGCAKGRKSLFFEG